MHFALDSWAVLLHKTSKVKTEDVSRKDEQRVTRASTQPSNDYASSVIPVAQNKVSINLAGENCKNGKITLSPSYSDVINISVLSLTVFAFVSLPNLEHCAVFRHLSAQQFAIVPYPCANTRLCRCVSNSINLQASVEGESLLLVRFCFCGIGPTSCVPVFVCSRVDDNLSEKLFTTNAQLPIDGRHPASGFVCCIHKVRIKAAPLVEWVSAVKVEKLGKG